MAANSSETSWVLSTNAVIALERALMRAGQTPEQAAALVHAAMVAGSVVEVKAALARLVALIDASQQALEQNTPVSAVMDSLAQQMLSNGFYFTAPGSEEDVRAALKSSGLFDEASVNTVMLSWADQAQTLQGAFETVELTKYDHVAAPGDVLALLSQAAIAAGAQAGVAAATTATAGGLTAAQIVLGLLGAAVVVGSAGGSGADAAEADTTKPATLTVSLTDDTGSSASDNVTSSALLTLGGRESGATLEYSADGSTWGATFAPTEGSNTVYVRQTDAAGNVSDASQAFTFQLDTTAPNTGSTVMAVDRSGQTITLGLDEALVGAAPQASSFAVTTPNAGQATANPVSAVAINGSGEVVLTLTNAFNAGQVNVVYTKPATGAVLEDLAGNDVASFFSGVVADGYIRGAKVWVDTDGDGQKDVDTGVVSNEQGQFFLPIDVASSGALVMVGGVNIDTGLPNTIQLKAPKIEDFTKPVVINPLTTLVQTVLEQTPVDSRTADTLNQAQSKVVSSLGLTPGTDLLSFDPISEATSLQDAIDTAPQGQDTSALTAKLTTAVTAQKAAAQVVSAVSLVADGDDTASASTLSALASKIDTAQAGQTLEATLDATLDDVLTATPALQAKVGSAKAAVSAINNATSLDGVSQAQAVALDTVTPAAPVVSVAALTNSLTPEVTIQLDTTSVDGTAVVVGNEVEVFVEGISVKTVVLTAEMVASKQVKVTLPEGALAEDGDYSVTASITDRAGNQGDASDAYVFKLDTQAAAPVVALTNDTGRSETDLVTNDAALSVTGTEEDATVEYSTDGETWSSTPPAAVAGENTVYVRQTDLAGNVSQASAPLTFTLDTSAQAPSLALEEDTGTESGDAITSQGMLVVSGSEEGATFEYSTDGQVWTNTFTAAEGSNTAYVRQTDVAGNVSAASSVYAFTLDTQAAAPSLALAADSGSSTSDSVTNNGALLVTGTETAAAVEYRVGVDGDWTSTFSATEGLNTVYARQIDAAGNISDASTALEFTKDSTAPSALVSIEMAFDNVPVDSPDDLNSGATTNDNTPELSGTFEGELEAGEVIEVFDGQTSLGVATVDGNTWALTPATGLANGAHTFTAQAVDVAGNRGEVSVAFALTVDASVPAALASITQLQDNADGYLDALTTAETVASGGSSNDVTPLIQGTLSEALSTGEKVLVFNGTTLLGEALVNGTGWSLQLTDALAAGSQSLTATVENAGGNRSAVGDAFVFQLDTTSPEDPVIELDTEFALFKDASPSFSVMAEAGATLILGKDDSQGGSWVDASLYQVVESESNAGQFTFTAVGTLTDGDYALMARDAAGNISLAPTANGSTNGFRIDTTPPSAPEIQEIRLTNDATPTFTLSAQEDGLRFVLGTQTGETLVEVPSGNYSVSPNGDGDYTLEVTTELEDGVYGLIAVDPAGNTSPPASVVGDPSAFRVDTVVAATPTKVIYSDGFDNSLDAGDTVTLTFAEPLLINPGALGGVHSIAAQNAVNGFSNTYVVTLGETLGIGGTLSFAADGVADQAGNSLSAPLVVNPWSGEPSVDLLSLYAADIDAGADISISPMLNQLGDDAMYWVYVSYHPEDTLDLQSAVLITDSGVVRGDLPVGSFVVTTPGDSGDFAIAKLNLTDATGTLSAQSLVANLSQANTDSIGLHVFDATQLGQAIKGAEGGEIALPSARAVYDKAQLSNDFVTDFSDKFFVIDSWADGALLDAELTGKNILLTQVYGATSSSYFGLMDGDTPLKVLGLPGETLDVALFDGEVFAQIDRSSTDEGMLYVHLDVANEVVTVIDAATYQTVANADALPANVGTSESDVIQGSGVGDYIYGFAGDDEIVGGSGNDTIVGGLGDDILLGAAGNNTIIGGLGADTIVLEGVVDILVYESTSDSTSTSADSVANFGLDDIIDVSSLIAGAGYSELVVATSGVSLPIAFGDTAEDWVFSVSNRTGTTLSVGMYATEDIFPLSDGTGGGVFTVDVDLSLLPVGTSLGGVSSDFGVVAADNTGSIAFLSETGLNTISAGDWIGDLVLTLPTGTQESALQVSLKSVSFDSDKDTLIQFNNIDLVRDMDGLLSGSGGSADAVDDMVAMAFAAIDTLSDNQMVIDQDLDGKTLAIRFDTDPSVGGTAFSEVLYIEGIDVLLTQENFAVL